MKKQWITLLTGCVLAGSMLTGYVSKPQAAAGSDKGSRISITRSNVSSSK